MTAEHPDKDVCGAECADGTPCQHPIGSCPVPSHSDPDAENPHGRDFTLSEADHEDILEAARLGTSVRGCARAAGVSLSQLQRYLDAHPDFRVSFERARAQGEDRLIRDGLYDDGTDSSMAKFLLASSFDYKKTEKREVEGEHTHTLEDGFEFEFQEGDDS